MSRNGDRRRRGQGVGALRAATFKVQEKPVAVKDEAVDVTEAPPLDQQVRFARAQGQCCVWVRPAVLRVGLCRATHWKGSESRYRGGRFLWDILRPERVCVQMHQYRAIQFTRRRKFSLHQLRQT